MCGETQEAQRSLCSQISKRGPECETHRAVPSREGKGHITCYLPRRPGATMLGSLVTFVLSVWPRETIRDPPPDPYHRLLNLSNLPLWEVSHVVNL